MNYLITTQWPPREGDSRPAFSGVYLAGDRGAVGRALQEGDLVLVYQSQSGRALLRRDADGALRRVPTSKAKGGIVAICRARAPFHWDEDAKPEMYDGATTIHWAWFAPLEVISNSGFVPREELNRLMGYAGNYALRGFGDRASGLKRIGESTYRTVERAFVASRAPTPSALPPDPPRGGPAGGESKPHRRLKAFVAGSPGAALGEDDFVLTRMEHVFPTNDRADVVLSDRFGRVVAVEVEVHVGDQDLEGSSRRSSTARCSSRSITASAATVAGSSSPTRSARRHAGALRTIRR